MAAAGQRALERELDDMEVDGQSDEENVIYGLRERQDLQKRHYSSLREHTQQTYGTTDKKFYAWAKERHQVDVVATNARGDYLIGDRCAELLAAFIRAAAHKDGLIVDGKQYQAASIATLNSMRSALTAFWRKQHELAQQYNPPELSNNTLFKKEFETAKNNLEGKGARPEGVDPQVNTAADPITREEMAKMVYFLQAPGAAAKLGRTWNNLRVAKLLCLITLLYFSVGRSDDSRLMYIADICKPMLLQCVGPCVCYALLIVLRGGKAQKNGQAAYAQFIRTKDVLMCPVGSAGGGGGLGGMGSAGSSTPSRQQVQPVAVHEALPQGSTVLDLQGGGSAGGGGGLGGMGSAGSSTPSRLQVQPAAVHAAMLQGSTVLGLQGGGGAGGGGGLGGMGSSTPSRLQVQPAAVHTALPQGSTELDLQGGGGAGGGGGLGGMSSAGGSTPSRLQVVQPAPVHTALPQGSKGGGGAGGSGGLGGMGRAPNAFMLFQAAFRAEVAEGKKTASRGLASLAGQRWREMSDEDKRVWYQRAMERRK